MSSGSRVFPEYRRLDLAADWYWLLSELMEKDAFLHIETKLFNKMRKTLLVSKSDGF